MVKAAALQASPPFEGDKGQTDSGLPAVGIIPWGAHFCVFYETNQDLLHVLARYFSAGLSANEFCLWLISPYQFPSISEGTKALAQVLPGLAQHLKHGRIEIFSNTKWFAGNKRPSMEKAVARFHKRIAQAQRRGFAGSRVIGTSAWVRALVGSVRFLNFERKMDVVFARQQAVGLCTFPLRLSNADEIFDAARAHEFALVVRNGEVERLKIDNIGAARKEALRSRDLEHLSFRQRQILQHISEGLNTKQIAALLDISIKTVEAHRLQLMRRLKIDNVPGLVRFAIRTGLVSAAA